MCVHGCDGCQEHEYAYTDMYFSRTQICVHGCDGCQGHEYARICTNNFGVFWNSKIGDLGTLKYPNPHNPSIPIRVHSRIFVSFIYP